MDGEHRRAADRRGLRYPSDLTDTEWAIVPADDRAGQARRPSPLGGPARDAERHLLRALDRLPVAGAAQGPAAEEARFWDYLSLWDWDGTIERIHHALYVAERERAGRQASPTTAIIDSQTAKAAQKGGPRTIPLVTMRARRPLAASATS